MLDYAWFYLFPKLRAGVGLPLSFLVLAPLFIFGDGV